MDGRTFLVFVVGLLVGAAVGWVAHRLLSKPTYESKSWDITDACTRSDGKIQISVTVPQSTPEWEFVRFHTDILDTTPNPIPSAPGSGAVPDGSTSPIVRDHPAGGLQGQTDCVVVWAEFRVYDPRHLVSSLPPCAGSGSGSGAAVVGRSRTVSVASAEQLEAVPRAYRLSLEGPAMSATGLVATLARATETQLCYVPEVSSPVEPVWQAPGESEAVREWSLSLLHRNGGFGAVLSAVCLLGDREVRLTWVTSNWQFFATNRLCCESDEAAGLSLLVRPA